MLLATFFLLFFNATATTAIYTLSLPDALPISVLPIAVRQLGDKMGSIAAFRPGFAKIQAHGARRASYLARDRKSTRLNSSHVSISYAVFCLKKKKNNSSLQCSSIVTLKLRVSS